MKKRKQKKKRKLYQAFLKSTLIVCSLLLCLLVIHLIHLTVTDMQEKSASARNAYGKTAAKLTSGKKQVSNASKNGTDSKKTAAPSQTDAVSADRTNSSSDNQSAFDKQSASDKQSVFGKQSASSNTVSSSTTLVFAGDIYLSDYVLASYNQSGIQGILSQNMLKELRNADIAMINNEFPYSTRGSQAPDKQFTFRVDPSYVSVLKEAGIDIVTIANNHVLDYGTDALSDTFQTLDEAGIDYAGAGDSLQRASRLITKKVNGHTFGFLAASRVFPVVSWNVEVAQPGVFSAYDPEKLICAVKDASKQCDFLCVYVHWGIERSTTPEAYQVSMAHALIDAGADAVIGAHPHVLQGVEYYNGKPVFYSLGNFIFYQTIEQTAVARLTLSPDGCATWQLLPAKAAGTCTTLMTDEAECRSFYEYMKGISVNTDFAGDGTVKQLSHS